MNLPAGGFIVRTNAEGKSEGEFAADVEFLTRLWAQVQGRFEQAAAPAVLHEEGDLTFRVVRDLFSPEIDEFVVDSRDGGLTFGDEVRVTRKAFDLDLAPRASAPFLGDYVGLAHDGTTFVPFFTQTISASNPTDVFASFVGP